MRVKTELCLAKKATPAPVAVNPSAEFVLDRVLRAAMPQDGPVWLEYDDVLDIFMYSHEEIDKCWGLLAKWRYCCTFPVFCRLWVGGFGGRFLIEWCIQPTPFLKTHFAISKHTVLGSSNMPIQ